MKLDKNKPFATITGHPLARYEQDGKLFDGQFVQISTTRRNAVEKSLIIETDEVDSSKRFLQSILQQGPLSKPKIFQVAEQNNQSWENVRKAADILNLAKYQYGGQEMWKLTEDA